MIFTIFQQEHVKFALDFYRKLEKEDGKIFSQKDLPRPNYCCDLVANWHNNIFSWSRVNTLLGQDSIMASPISSQQQLPNVPRFQSRFSLKMQNARQSILSISININIKTPNIHAGPDCAHFKSTLKCGKG